ncbi:putative mitochondrial chaperone [Neofusicoccum parvum]|uniref:Mitochondrial chaperone n=1 Tax=Neofusicoccum parvum TaxID=310453 RepID=A0ACB5S0B3_9PEZI|nr:putative mitochondrial chaperone [Neofusicoccum parvum]
MPPAKARPHDPDARSDASAKEKHPTTSHTSHARGRRAGGGAALTNGSHLKEVISASADATSSANRNGGQPAHTGSSGGEYRASHRLEAPSAFKNPLGHAILGSGIGKYSPTMARKKNERRILKEQLATAVRKNFNALAVSESEVIVDLLYKVKMQDKTFRMRFPPPRTR